MNKLFWSIVAMLVIGEFLVVSPEWNAFIQPHFFKFLRSVDFPIEGWALLDEYLFNGAL